MLDGALRHAHQTRFNGIEDQAERCDDEYCAYT
jgi:hypothetical protein